MIDLAPTVLAMLRIDRPAGFVGKPLDELIENRTYSYANKPAYAVSWNNVADPENPDGPSVWVEKMASRTPEWKYVYMARFEQVELYDLTRDPEERRNVYRRYPEVCEEQRRAILETLQPAGSTSEAPRPPHHPGAAATTRRIGLHRRH